MIRQRRQWHPTPVLLPGKSHGQRSLVGCSPWSHQELDTTEQLHFDFSLSCIGEGNGNPLQCSWLENPRDGEPGGLLSMGSHRVRHDWSDLAAAAAAVTSGERTGVRSVSRAPRISGASFCRLCFPSLEIATWILGRCLKNIKERLEIICKTNFLYLIFVFILDYWERVLNSGRKKKFSAEKIGATNFNDIFLDHRVIYDHCRKFIKQKKLCRKIQISLSFTIQR